MSAVYSDISYDLATGIFSVLNTASGTIDGAMLFYRVDEVSIDGTGGTASVTCDGVTRTATFHTSATVTASDFVTVHAAAYLAGGVVVTSESNIIRFTSNVPGASFTGSTSVTNLTGDLHAISVSATNENIPVYKSIQKEAPEQYVYIGEIVQGQEGTKDNFMYFGTVNIIIVDDSQYRGDKKKALQILNLTRSLLKPSITAVPNCGSKTVVTFTPSTYNEFIEQSDKSISLIRLIDTYNFLIN
jgi:hypothetical protein